MAALPMDALMEAFREPESAALSPRRVAEELHLQMQDLASLAGVHRNTLLTHPESPRAQQGMRDLVRVYVAALEAQPVPMRAVFFLHNTPLQTFGFKTAMELVREGRTEDVLAYLASIAAGFSG